MDYLFYSLGTMGDALPFIKLAASINEGGAKAAFIGNEKFDHLASSMGVKLFSVSSLAAYQNSYNNPLTWSRHHAQNHYNDFHFPAIKRTFKTIESIIRKGHKPIIIYQDALSGARMAAEEFGLKSCQVVLAPQGIGSILSPPYPMRRQVEERLWGEIFPQIRGKAKKDTFDRLVRPLINPARKELGLAQWSLSDLPDMETSPSILALFPAWLKPNPGDWPKQLVNTGFILGETQDSESNARLDEFINQYGAPLVFTFGTGIPVTNLLIDKIRNLCRIIGKPGIFVAHSKNESFFECGEFPVLILPSVPFSYLFARAALVIHHGGIGTCAQALATGIPQVISPYTFDQPDNAFLLWQLGISNAIDFLSDSVNQIASCVMEVLSSHSIKEKVKYYQNLTTDETESSVQFLLSLKE
ncbi:nucleotide disphospho-sugar-binding domain-containing protein [Cellvibrio polysaccharolyticus]|nr:nucleotide disphospho-sugar-binding domain-containing protein [Cellvibrio polysaccharolyticus]